ncbi:MAG: alpha/beta hydrolase [Acidobacteria bacterium]|nr:alpha/beta hydrolase [Acidobacteriota bacterium]
MRRVLWMVGVLASLLVAGRVFEVVMWHRDAGRDPEPGRRVGGWQIHCTGRGSPAVLLEAGLGDGLVEWRRVQPAVAEFARVCSYDRAGYGWSDEGVYPRTSARIGEELHGLLRSAGEHGPFVVVGHSAGGYHVRVFHGKYASEVVGMVLVDAVQEDQYKLLPGWEGIARPVKERYRGQARWAWLEVEFGILRLRLWMEGIGAPYALLQSKFFRTRWSELEQMEVSAEQARAAGGLGGKPLIVVTGEREALRGWKEVQSRLAGLSTDSKWVVLADSGHDVPADRPDAVVAAIREVVAKAAK